MAWSLRNALAVRRLVRAAAAPAACPPPAPRAAAVLVTGATGFVGGALVDALRREGRRVIVLARDGRQARASFDVGVQVVESLDAIAPETPVDAIVNLAGARVLGRPWTRARRRELLASRVETTAAVVALMGRLARPPRVLVSASAVGWYGGSQSFEAVDEAGLPRPWQFQSELCVAIERAATRAEALGVRVVPLRLGVVLGRGDGAFPPLALAARCGLGAVLGSGHQAAPWIHLDDAVGLVRFALAQDKLAGPVNAVAPDTRPQAAFARALAASLGRRVRLRVPHRPMRCLLGEMGELLLEGQHAVPAAALRAGYSFRFPTLEAAFEDLLAKPPARHAAPERQRPSVASLPDRAASGGAACPLDLQFIACPVASTPERPGQSPDSQGDPTWRD
jgi:uncharacterized protein (TIGR01777 family)